MSVNTSSTPTSGIPDYDLDDMVVVTEPAQLRALADDLRGSLLELVLERAATVTELAQAVGRPKSTVAYHVNLLVDAGLFKVVRTQRVRAIEERYYGRVGRTIVFDDHSPGEVPFLHEMLSEVDLERSDDETTGGFTYRHARIPRERAQAYIDRLYELTLEFIDEPRDGDVEYGMYVGVFPTNRQIAPATEEEKP